jgi:DNA-binding transcriptional LysR family regulator
MELRHLTAFVAVAEEASFSRAADRLHVVQSSVSETIRALEREWGVALFHRTTHRVALSAEGRALLGEARAALAAAAGVTQAVDELHGGLRGHLRLGIMQATPRPRGISVARALSAFLADHPQVTVEVRQGASATQAEAVRRGELDLAFVGLPARTLPGLEVVELTEDRIELLCAPGHRLAGRTWVDLRSIVDEPFAELPPGWGVRTTNDIACASAGVVRRMAYEVNDIPTVLDFVRHGLAVALMPEAIGADADGIAHVAVRGYAPRFAFSLVLPAELPVGPAARAFAATARESLVG